MTSTPARRAAYANEAMVHPDHPDQHMVAYVDEDTPGYWATTYTGPLDYVRAVADSINESLGLTPEDVTTIVASSMRHSSLAGHSAPQDGEGQVAAAPVRRSRPLSQWALTDSTHPHAECEQCRDASVSAAAHAAVTGSVGATWTTEGPGRSHTATVHRADLLPDADELTLIDLDG